MFIPYLLESGDLSCRRLFGEGSRTREVLALAFLHVGSRRILAAGRQCGDIAAAAPPS